MRKPHSPRNKSKHKSKSSTKRTIRINSSIDWLEYDYNNYLDNLPDSKHDRITKIYKMITNMNKPTLIKHLEDNAQKHKKWETERAVYEYSQDDDQVFTTKKGYVEFLKTLSTDNLQRELLLQQYAIVYSS